MSEGKSDVTDRFTFENHVSEIESLLSPIEEELEEIGSSGNFEDYENFIENYSEFILHPNHYLLMTAARNLVQVRDVQCDQMARLFAQYLAIYNRKNVPKNITILPKWVQNFVKH